ncbi:hypothetical protein Lal_00036376 [Lupinus albus]|nr:hypothetical protein Lal_00036376 [Lupinus albus]
MNQVLAILKRREKQVQVQARKRKGTLAAKAFEGPRFARVLRATSAAACSACRRVEKNVGLSNVSPLKLTVALKRGA